MEDFKTVTNVKKMVKRTIEEEVEVEEIKWDWSRIPTGSKFKAKIEGKSCEGRIYNNMLGNSIFFCQDVKDGASAPDKLGYEFSWIAYKETFHKNDDISDLEIELDPEYNECATVFEMELTSDYNITVDPNNLNYVKVGCQRVPMRNVYALVEKVKELKNRLSK